jgi:4-amino-4-deoxy-L-arabinose transferase-like glycosyltransferase
MKTTALEAPAVVLPVSMSIQGLRSTAYIVGILTLFRALLAARLPLSFDEAYFWLWSKHLAISYYDHPPMIALAIRAGTFVFGDTELGVRFVPFVASIAASWAVWRSAGILLNDARAAAMACCYFNVTLMIAAESMSGTPDSLIIAASSFLLLALAKLEATKDGRWWLAAGLATGLALFTKYTAFFLCLSVTIWLVITPRGRAWLRTPWPYMGAILALAFLTTTLIWNTTHDWISFRFQFGRITEGRTDPRFMLEFIESQIALASPFVLILGLTGLLRESRLSYISRPLSFAIFMVWPALIYFLIHSLHDRVQGNWPSFVYPAFAVLAASALFARSRFRWMEAILRPSRFLAIPAAILILAVAYAQAFFGVLPMGRHDPIARMTAVGFRPVADEISALARQNNAAGIVTTNYVPAAWLSFYLRPHLPIIEIGEEYRWLSAPSATPYVLNHPLLYVTENPRHESIAVSSRFHKMTFLTTLERQQSGVAVDHFSVYYLGGFYGQVTARAP